MLNGDLRLSLLPTGSNVCYNDTFQLFVGCGGLRNHSIEIHVYILENTVNNTWRKGFPEDVTVFFSQAFEVFTFFCFVLFC